MRHLYCIIVLIVLFGPSSTLIAQTVKGKVNEFAVVQIEGKGIGTQADEKGVYSLELPNPGSYTLLFSLLGFESQKITFTIRQDETKIIDAVLTPNTKDLQEVQISSKSEAQSLREQGIKVDVISTKAIQQESATLTEVMNRSSGIRVRQTGGLGSAANVMINGFQGKAVKYFKDGIPVDYLGGGFNINLVPINILDRIEIYKGVLPSNLGADALGGAVNLVSKTSLNRFLDLAYEFASFNTHRATLNGYFRNQQTNTFVGADAFYNYSDNNYLVDVKVIDEFTRTRRDAKVRRFHDYFKNYYGEVYGGFVNTPWADLLKIGLSYYHIDKAEQHGALMTDPFGEVISTQSALVPTIRYKKSWLDGRLSFDQFLVLNTIHSERIDTCHCTFDWYGKKTLSSSRQGESDSDGSLSNITFDNLTARTYFQYRLNEQHTLDANAVYSSYTRQGSDPFGAKYLYSGRDILSVPASYDKWVVSFGWQSTFLKKLTNNLIFKYFKYKTSGTDALYASANENQISSTGDRFGLAEALKWTLNSYSFLRLSAEIATRLPENTEVFGDGLFEMSNFSLKPEQSFNLNLGYRIQLPEKYSLEFNTFYRFASNLIVQVPANIIFLQHQNVDKVRGLGLEIDANIQLNKWLSFGSNLTYQDLRLIDIEDPSAKFLEGSRVRNTPYFFGGLNLKSTHNHVFVQKDQLQSYWYFTYVNEFYLEPIPKDREAGGFLGIGGKASIDTELIIPSQHLHTLGVSYRFPEEKTSLSLEIKNLLDSQLYDNFRVQRAGRSIHLKLRYLLK